MKLCVAGLLAMLALLPAWSTTANVPNTVASGEVPTSAGAVTVPLNQAAIDKLNYCRERGLTFWLGVRSSDEETKLLWFYDPIHFVVNGTELSPLPTTYVGFPHPGVDKHRIGTSWGYEPNHWNFLCSGHAGDSGGGWEPGMVTRGMEQYQVTVGQPVTTAVVQVPASVAAYSSPGVTYHFVVFAEDFTFAWQEYPYNSNYPQATGTPIHNDSAKAYRIWNGMSTEYAPGAPPWYAPPSVTPTNGDPVNLVTGEEDHAAAPDISVRDSVSPLALHPPSLLTGFGRVT
jgi:hypothetical protein